MATSNITADIKKSVRGSSNSVTMKNENYMVLSTTYALNNSDTKRIHVGLRMLNEDATFEPSIKLTGNSSAGIYFDRNTWKKFQENLDHVGSYLRGVIKDTPDPVPINDVIIHFTSAYGARAIMVSYREKKEEEAENTEPAPPAAKKRRIFTPSIVMQKITFEGLENVVKCVNARCEQLVSLASLAGDCARFLTKEIELNLPKRSVNEDIIKQAFVERNQEVEQNVRRQIKNLEFLDTHFEIVFHELGSIFFNEIVKTIMTNATSA